MNRLACRTLASALITIGFGATALHADVRFAPGNVVFTDHMVVQRDVPIPVWGLATPGEHVAVTLGPRSAAADAQADGRWSVSLDSLPAGGPWELVVTGPANQLKIADVAVGEVWVAAGQSNMVRGRPSTDVLRQHPRVRAVLIQRWNDPAWARAQRPGGAAFWFGVQLAETLGVTVGIINEAAGGTVISKWLPDSVRTPPCSDPDPYVCAWVAHNSIGGNYRARLRPLQPYAVKGAVWWQGETDQERAGPEHWGHLLGALIRGWRRDWGIGDFPFVFVELPKGLGLQTGAPAPPQPTVDRRSTVNGSVSARMRQAAIRAVHDATLPATHVMPTIDLPGGVHPVDTPALAEAYGRRLDQVALGAVYGRLLPRPECAGGVCANYSGPIYDTVTAQAGGVLRLRFRPGTAEGLRAAGGQPLSGFEISGDGTSWVWSSAAIENGNQVVVSDPSAVPTPVAARYGWDDAPAWANLVNQDGYGAAPFSTVLE